MTKFRIDTKILLGLGLAALLALGLLAGCDKAEEHTKALESVKETVGEVQQALGAEDLGMVEKAAAIAAAIQKAPDTAAAVLEQHGLTREQFDGMMEKIKGNEQLKAAFDKAVAAL